ncbi:hypothetical protein ACQCU1_07095 [Sutcliffiella horikoshii]|uniref:Uncharacterized protein n=1 Tax=Sutcliffiella horikoshii TaxID=79883 RepID=A0A1Y0CM53_9BACI|nr:MULTISPECIES: hypothetical protein [Bacillaceae]ART75987.1 hypothetical protein B4U37_08060 [Sutcliffiella horikoshii]TYS61255.1 hypothetical protein FZC74_02985 [Sutcliffiella horikoshii]
MELVNISYMKKGQIQGFFDKFPHSKVLFSPIRKYYFVSYVYWDERDPIVLQEDLEKMELLFNSYMGREAFYRRRKRADTGVGGA